MTKPVQERLRGKIGLIVVVIGLAMIAGFLILQGHGFHLAMYAPFLVLLACPLLHMFMHRGHGAGGHQHGSGTNISS